MEQPDLFTKPAVKLPTEPQQTSIDAALKAAGRAGTMRRRVYELLRSSGPLTDEEIAEALTGALILSTPRARRIELVEAGLVGDSGQRRPTLSGSSSIAWTVVRVIPKPCSHGLEQHRCNRCLRRRQAPPSD